MARYIPYDPKQGALEVINFEDQLQPDTFEHALHYLIEHRLDLSVFGPLFGNLLSNKRLRQFSLRGKDKVQSQ